MFWVSKIVQVTRNSKAICSLFSTGQGPPLAKPALWVLLLFSAEDLYTFKQSYCAAPIFHESAEEEMIAAAKFL